MWICPVIGTWAGQARKSLLAYSLRDGNRSMNVLNGRTLRAKLGEWSSQGGFKVQWTPRQRTLWDDSNCSRLTPPR